MPIMSVIIESANVLIQSNSTRISLLVTVIVSVIVVVVVVIAVVVAVRTEITNGSVRAHFLLAESKPKSQSYCNPIIIHL